MHLVQHKMIPINLCLPTVILSSAGIGCSGLARLFRRIPLYLLVFLHTTATQHHLTGREDSGLTNREMAASCMDKAGRNEGVHCACRFLLGMRKRKKHGENMEECMEPRHKKKSLKLFSNHYFLQQWSRGRIFTVYSVVFGHSEEK